MRKPSLQRALPALYAPWLGISLVVACTPPAGANDEAAASSTSDDSTGDDGDTTGGDEPRPPCSFAERFDEGPYPPTIDDPFPPTVVDEWYIEGCKTTGNEGEPRTSSTPPCGDPCFENSICMPGECFLYGGIVGAIPDGRIYLALLSPEEPRRYPVFNPESGEKLEHRPLDYMVSAYGLLKREEGENDSGIFGLRTFTPGGSSGTSTRYVLNGRIEDVDSLEYLVKGSLDAWPQGFVHRSGTRYVIGKDIGNQQLTEVCTFDASDPTGPVEQLAPLGDEWIPSRGIQGIAAGDDVVYAGTIRYVPSTDQVFPWWTDPEGHQHSYVYPVVLEGDFDTVVCTQRRWEIASGGYEIRGVNCFDGSTAELVFESDFFEQYWRDGYDDYLVDARGRLLFSTGTEGVAFPGSILWRWDPATNTTEVLATHDDLLSLVGTHEDRVYVIRGDNNGCVESFLAP